MLKRRVQIGKGILTIYHRLHPSDIDRPHQILEGTAWADLNPLDDQLAACDIGEAAFNAGAIQAVTPAEGNVLASAAFRLAGARTSHSWSRATNSDNTP